MYYGNTQYSTASCIFHAVGLFSKCLLPVANGINVHLLYRLSSLFFSVLTARACTVCSGLGYTVYSTELLYMSFALWSQPDLETAQIEPNETDIWPPDDGHSRYYLVTFASWQALEKKEQVDQNMRRVFRDIPWIDRWFGRKKRYLEEIGKLHLYEYVLVEVH